MCGNWHLLSQYTRREAGKILVTTGQYHLHVLVPRFWSTLSILVSLIIWNIIKFYVTNNMVSNSIETVKSQLIVTVHNFAQSLNQGGQCDVLLLDFCKAFDKVPHLRLLQKLHHYGI